MSSLFDPSRNQEASSMGLIANISGNASRRIITKCLSALGRIAHRAWQMPNHHASDGCGILTSLPHNFFVKQWPLLQQEGQQPWAVGQLFFPRNEQLRNDILSIIRMVLKNHSLHLLDGREVPIAVNTLHKSARAALPHIAQILVCPAEDSHLSISSHLLEQRLFLARRVMEHEVKNYLQNKALDSRQFHVVSLSAHTITYKALVSGAKLGEFYPDLQHDAFTAQYAIFHQRFSNNRISSWRAAQPMRMLAHCGEIHCLRGIESHFNICSPLLESSIFGQDLSKILPVIFDKFSPAISLDNLCEFLTRCGRSLPHVLMMLFPQNQNYIDNQEAFNKFNAALLPPLATDSCLSFSDGTRYIGAIQAAKSPQSCRYTISTDGLFMLCSDVGALDIATKNIKVKGRLKQGQLIILDLLERRILYDKEIKNNIIQEHRYSHLNTKYFSTMAELEHEHSTPYNKSALKHMFTPHNTLETLEYSPIIPIFDEHTASFFDYFNILLPQFSTGVYIAEVNLQCFVGHLQNPLEPHANFCKTLALEHPFINPNQVKSLLKSEQKHICLHTLTNNFEYNNKNALAQAIENIKLQAEQALKDGATMLMLSHINGKYHSLNHLIPLPSLLAVAALHSHLLKKQLRHLCGIIVESIDAHSPMHMVQLINAGADAICPHLTNSQELMQAENTINYHDYFQTLQIHLKKILSRLGLNSLTSLKDGHYFEAVGLHEQVVKKYFHNISSRLGGLRLEQVAHEAYMQNLLNKPMRRPLHKPNQIRLKQGQERHNHGVIKLLQSALQYNSMHKFSAYLKHYHSHDTPRSLRCLLKFKEPSHRSHIKQNQIEPACDILKRFITPPMAKLSKLAKQCLIQGYYDAGCSQDYDSSYTKIPHTHEIHFQRQSLTAKRVVECEEILICLNSENPFDHAQAQHDLSSFNDIEQLIYDLRRVHPHTKIAIKIPAHAGIGNMGVGLVKAGAHCLLVDGRMDIALQSPLFPLSTHILPLEMGLAELQHALTASNLRRQTRLRVQGQFFTGKDILKATLLGAEEFVFPTASLLSLGCTVCNICLVGPCPHGLLDNDEDQISDKFKSATQNITRFLTFLAEDVRRELGLLGFAYLDQLVGKANLLEICSKHSKHKCAELNLSVLTQASSGTLGQRSGTPSYAPPHNTALEDAILEKLNSHSHKKSISCNYCGTINVNDRSIGTHISGEIIRHKATKYRNAKTQNIDSNTCLNIKLWGCAGQSLGAFLTHGITLCVFGDANDHVGRGLSGGTIAISHAPDSPLEYGPHTLIGNVALYGASAGNAYIAGMAGEYFAAHNNGACAVVEGVGDYACLHMHDGTIIVLGPCGRDFAADMRGGQAFVYAPAKAQEQHSQAQSLDADDKRTLHYLIKQHIHFTKSIAAKNILNNWHKNVEEFIVIKA